jgi:hypothetical protein
MVGGGAGGVDVLPPCKALLKGGWVRMVLCGGGGGGLSCESGSVRVISWSGGTRWYSLGVRSEKADTAAALTGVGNTLADAEVVYPDRAESLLSGLMMELGIVDAVNLSSSDCRGRP